MAANRNERIWSGDPTTVAEARAAYKKKTTDQNLINYAVALYSFRQEARFRSELIDLLAPLAALSEKLIGTRTPEPTSALRTADMIDVLSTHLEWMGRHADQKDQPYALQVANRLVWQGVDVLKRSYLEGTHTHCLLRLTAARLSLYRSEQVFARRHLDIARSHMTGIEDVNQRARVYRKYGLLSRHLNRHFSGFYWGIRACLVPKTPRAVRVKSFAALAGIDR